MTTGALRFYKRSNLMKISDIQNYLKKQHCDAYIVTRHNMFIGQDVLPKENKILELTGFDGSAGNLIVFVNRAILLVDGRYDIMAKNQTNPEEVEVICSRDSIASWLRANLHEPHKILYDAWCHSASETDYWHKSLDWHKFAEDKDCILGSRIVNSDAEIFELKEEFAGISSEEKISYVTDFLKENNLDAYLFCECDSVSWLMNLRSDLIKYSPVLRAYALVNSNGEVSLFTNNFEKLNEELKNYKKQKIGINFSKTPKAIFNYFKDNNVITRNINNPIINWKSLKNPVEITGFRNCHIRDGVALCRFLCWLEKNFESTDELGCVEKLHQLRAEQNNFYDDSFACIAGFGSNGAIIHYHPCNQSNKKLNKESLLLLDSGGQYFDGTTDVTRTIAFGKQNTKMIEDYTFVLKAHIGLSRQLFPEGVTGAQLDAITRSYLWNYGQDYAHGTGHGVGHFLNVHEGPESISLKNQVPLQKGMVCSIEPGIYNVDNYGIRIENLALVVEKNINLQTFLGFDTLTLVPYDKKLIDKNLLSKQEIDWINAYHKKIGEILLPLLDKDTSEWLKIQIKEL